MNTNDLIGATSQLASHSASSSVVICTQVGALRSHYGVATLCIDIGKFNVM